MLLSPLLAFPLHAATVTERQPVAEAVSIDASLPLPVELSAMLHALKKARGFSAGFRQSLHFSDGSGQHYRGELEALPPGRFRWHYIEPFEQLFVSDGVTIWHYEPDLMQVSVLKDMADVDPAVMQLLDGSLGLADVHLLEARPAEHRYYVRLAAKTRVWLGLRNGRLGYVEGLDALGNTNRISLQNMKLTAPDIERFTFVVPKGVDVVPLH